MISLRRVVGSHCARTSRVVSAEPEEFPRSFPYTWAMLLARIYESLPLVCPRCGSAMRIIAFITNGSDVKRILDHIGEASEPPPVSPSRAPPEEAFAFNPDRSREEAFDFDQWTEWDDEPEV
ncbi:MAG: hypothetical protein GTO29_03785 [Candidatus Latescibacteria bacterium]|nr:hypothetical protein [Candidatus Latescibacterota bacterium]NIO55197.1 hypothetical protein [Candidatus Latescibacterota bacterium]